MIPVDEEQQRRKMDHVQAETFKLAELAVQTANAVNYEQKHDPAFVAAILATVTAIYIKNT